MREEGEEREGGGRERRKRKKLKKIQGGTESYPVAHAYIRGIQWVCHSRCH